VLNHTSTRKASRKALLLGAERVDVGRQMDDRYPAKQLSAAATYANVQKHYESHGRMRGYLANGATGRLRTILG